MKRLDSKSGKLVEFVPECSDPRYLRAMARMLDERGYRNLAQAHRLWANEEEEVARTVKTKRAPRISMRRQVA